MGLKDPEARRAYQRARYAADPSKFAAANKRWYEKNSERQYRRKQERHHANIARQLEAQGGVCAICGADGPGGRGGWHRDHDHATGKWRDLLCHYCNVGLGHFQDDPELLEKAATYLRRH